MKPLVFLKQGGYTVSLRWTDNNTLGLCYFDRKRIVLNPWMMIAYIFIHEALHAQFPKRGEARIEALARRTIHKMTKRQVMYLAQRVLKEAR